MAVRRHPVTVGAPDAMRRYVGAPDALSASRRRARHLRPMCDGMSQTTISISHTVPTMSLCACHLVICGDRPIGHGVRTVGSRSARTP